MQIFRLYWMMKNIRLLNVCEVFSETPKRYGSSVLHHPVQIISEFHTSSDMCFQSMAF